MMRVVLLHTRLSGYLAACLRALKLQTGCEFLIYVWPNQPDAPFGASQFEDLGTIRNRHEFSDREIEKSVWEFAPDAILTSGWADKGYLKICRHLKKNSVPVIAGCDTQWTGSLRQQIAGMTAALHVRRAIDVLWVTGERQATLARALGFSGNSLWDGYYACDWSKFSSDKAPRPTSHAADATPYFLFVGRYVPEKGIDTLAEAYRLYCEGVKTPWPLICAGSGPLKQILCDAGAVDRGFVQPDKLPDLMQNAAAFILPSRFEPWGVVVQEAAASGLPLILADQVGAGVHLLRPRFNGYSFPAGSTNSLTQNMLEMHLMSPEKRMEMSRNSGVLSRQYTPERWANTFISGLIALQGTPEFGLSPLEKSQEMKR
jgi:glycosyltransferase involved in cell wall biosynthesis